MTWMIENLHRQREVTILQSEAHLSLSFSTTVWLMFPGF